MSAFELPDVTECKLTHVNHRHEFHGEDRVLAVDMNFEMEGPNDLLDKLDPKIRQRLYTNDALDAGQVEMPDALQVRPNLTLPHLNGGKHKWRGNDKFKGYGFELDYGLGGDSSIHFTDAAVGKHEFETKEGGTVVLSWQVSYAGEALTDDVLVKLIRHEQKQVFIKITAPPVLVLLKGGKEKVTAGTVAPDEGGLFDAGAGADGEGGEESQEGDEGSDDSDTSGTPLGALINSVETARGGKKAKA